MHPFKRIKIGSTGEQLPDTATDNAAVLFPELGLMVANKSIGIDGEASSQDGIAKEVAKQSIAGFDDWSLADDFAASLVFDRSRDPCIDADFFSAVKADWHWTSTPTPWSSSAAFGVDFNGGYVSGNLRFFDGFGLAVRRVGQ